MPSPTFLLINEQPISINQVFDYLHMADTFQEFLLDILCQHAVMEEVRSQTSSATPLQDGLNPSTEAIEQYLIDFRTENDLMDADDFQAWLITRGLTYENFRQQLVWQLSLNHLKNQISQPQLTNYFQKRKPFLDQVTISWLSAETEKQVKDLRRRLNWGAKFAQLVAAQANSSEPDSGLEIPLCWEEMPGVLQAAVETAHIGDVVGPLWLDDRWYLFRVEAFQPAELDEVLETQLKNELFEQWLTEKVQDMTVTLQLN